MAALSRRSLLTGAAAAGAAPLPPASVAAAALRVVAPNPASGGAWVGPDLVTSA